jgi:hypothetical protein
MSAEQAWTFLAVGYPLTVLFEAPVLLVGLSRRHSLGARLFAGFWLTACTYPVVILVLPVLFEQPAQRLAYAAVAETFAPAAECALFWSAFGARRSMWGDFAAIALANLTSFTLGVALHRAGAFDWLG